MLILASASPRRKEILEKLGFCFCCDPANIDETLPSDIFVSDSAEYLAVKKASEGLKQHPRDVVIGSDTVVVIDNRILGKPKSREEAVEMLRTLSGRAHTVYTGVAVASAAEMRSFTASVEVKFAEMSQDDIEWYVSTGEPMDKAGAYAVQGLACRFIEAINGDYYAVMGLPAHELYKTLSEFNLGEM